MMSLYTARWGAGGLGFWEIATNFRWAPEEGYGGNTGKSVLLHEKNGEKIF
jgi:hypothetical protein